MSAEISTRVVLASFALGLPSLQNFRLEQSPVGEIVDGEVLLAVRLVSVDAHMRAHDPISRYSATPLSVGCVVEADGVAEVLESKHADFRAGEIVIARTGWQTRARLPGSVVHHLPMNRIGEETALVTLGTVAMTAYVGLREVAQAKQGETFVVPAATGPIGWLAGQFARTMGMWTVGIVSSKEERAFALGKLGFHSVLDRTATGFGAALRDACSGGIDVFFENLGGALFRDVRPLMNDGGRIVLTGTWTQYTHLLGGAGEYASPATLEAVLGKHLVLGAPTTQSVSFDSLVEHVSTAIMEGSLWSQVHVESGLHNAVHSWLTAIDSPHRGTTVIRL